MVKISVCMESPASLRTTGKTISAILASVLMSLTHRELNYCHRIQVKVISNPEPRAR